MQIEPGIMLAAIRSQSRCWGRASLRECMTPAVSRSGKSKSHSVMKTTSLSTRLIAFLTGFNVVALRHWSRGASRLVPTPQPGRELAVVTIPLENRDSDGGWENGILSTKLWHLVQS